MFINKLKIPVTSVVGVLGFYYGINMLKLYYKRTFVWYTGDRIEGRKTMSVKSLLTTTNDGKEKQYV